MPSDPTTETAQVHGGWRTAGFAAIAGVVVALSLAPSFAASGPPMDEGILVSYPDLVLKGAVPGRDFETFYGPGGPYLTAGAFAVLGHHLWVERSVGLLARLVIVLSIFVIALPWGRRLSAAAAIVAGLVMFPLGLAAYALLWGLAWVLLSLALVVAGSTFVLGPRRRSAAYVLAGAAAGVALLFRPDLLPAALLPVVPLIREARRAKQYAAGLVVAVIPLVIYLGVVGTSRLHLVVRDLLASRAGRRLPIPSLSSTEGQLLVAATTATVLLVVVGALGVWRRRVDLRARILLSIGLLLLTLYPVIANRADSAHIVPVAAVAVSFFLILAVTFVRRHDTGGARTVKLLVIGVAALFVAAAFLHVSLLGFRDDARIVRGSERGYDVRLSGSPSRGFLVDSRSTARDLNRLLPVIDRVTSPGDSLFVGPRDLRRTNYNDAFVYFLLPALKPASFYLELNPGTANRSGSSLASDLQTADVLLLTTRYDDWNEPNASAKQGSTAPSAVVAARFCRIAQSGTYTVLRRCR